ncbi:MAG: hypothetical protein JSW34_12735 [Candidatus Zixiibacteriota bacterium]|nr:MAG: hypothetical protein JSW34_12735 [candidate division Zixibacteria bacterium]
MTALALAALMSLPLYPLNPTVQDTLNHMNLHVTAGMNGPSSVVSGGPELTVKYEMLFNHPFVLRAALDYRYGEVSSATFPDGDMHRAILSGEWLYYRGTDRLTGYLGVGIVWSLNHFTPSPATADSLLTNFGITDVSVSDAVGFRITAGLRILRSYSIEIGITETNPKYIYYSQLSPDRFSLAGQRFRFNDFRVTVGYLFTLKM